MAAESPPAAAGGSAGLWRRRLTAQGLAGPALGSGRDGAIAVARRILSIQAQDPRGARLAIRSRTRGTTGADVERALTEERSLVLTWLNRGTLHLTAAEDYPLLQALTTPQLRTSSNTRLAQTGVTPDRARTGVAVLDAALADEGPLPASALRERLREAGVITGAQEQGPAFTHVLIAASLDGVLVRGPMAPAQGSRAPEHAYARVADWLPDAPAATRAVAADRERSLAELARRFLAGHGPADEHDLTRWAGIRLGDARRGLTAIASQLRERRGGGRRLVELAAAGRAGRRGTPRLLGAYEPVLMGWTSRAWVLGEREREAAVVTGGIFRGFALVDGRAAGVWRFRGRGVELEPFSALPAATRAALAAEADAVTSFLGRD